MQAFKIVTFSVLAAITYGIVHDQITARICIEYFTIGHPKIFNTESLTLLALGWGVLATWWVGLILGCILAISARFGRKRKVDFSEVRLRILKLLVMMFIFSIIGGLVGYFLASNGLIALVGPIFEKVPAEMHVPYLVDLWAHTASYLSGFVGGIVLSFKVWRSRFESKKPV